MRKKLHPVVLTVGIMQVAFGVLGLCCGGVSAVDGAMVYSDPSLQDSSSQARPVGTPGARPTRHAGNTFVEEVIRRCPAYGAFEIGRGCVGLFLAVLMIASGVGLFFMQSWARWLAVGYAALSFLSSCANVGYQAAVYVPAVHEVAAESAGQNASYASGAKVGAYVALAITLVTAVYPLVVAVLLLIPPVHRAFRGEPAPREPWDDDRDRDDYRDRFNGRDRYQNW